MADIITTFGVEVDPNPVKRGVRESNRALGSLKSSFRLATSLLSRLGIPRPP
jgi:hypothetical protein